MTGGFDDRWILDLFYDSGFLKYLLFFKKLYLILLYKNDLKIYENFNFNKNIICNAFSKLFNILFN